MGGGLMQLVAYGAQDIYLTGNPQITFFKVVYRRHTNFSMECIEQTINGTPSGGGNSSVTISRNGDLVGRVYVTLDTDGACNGSNLVSEVELEIGGQLIDRQYSEWMNIWNELTVKCEGLLFKEMLGDTAHAVGSEDGDLSMLQVPLRFWFCRNPGCYLPLIALQYHEVKLQFTWGNDADIGGVSPANAKVWADYVYLDTDERRRFAQVSHEYLIEQVQRESLTGAQSLKLNFNHPVKELIWTDTGNTNYGTARLTLNGHDRFADQKKEYFQFRQPFDYHSQIPKQNSRGSAVNSPHEAISSVSTTGTTTDVTVNLGTDGHIIDDIQVSIIGGDITLAVNTDLAGITADTSAATGDGIIASDTDNFKTATASATIPAGTTLSTISTTNAMTGVSALRLVTNVITGNQLFVRLTLEATPDAATGTDGAQFKVVVTSRPTSGYPGLRSILDKEINVYSFALKPEEHQPSGTCNFSRIDSSRLEFGTAPSGTVNVYAHNYNVLRIMSGMGGLAYSN